MISPSSTRYSFNVLSVYRPGPGSYHCFPPSTVPAHCRLGRSIKYSMYFYVVTTATMCTPLPAVAKTFYRRSSKSMNRSWPNFALTVYSYTSALQTVALFGLNLRRLPAMVGALSFLVFSTALIIPHHASWYRSANFTTFIVLN